MIKSLFNAYLGSVINFNLWLCYGNSPLKMNLKSKCYLENLWHTSEPFFCYLLM